MCLLFIPRAGPCHGQTVGLIQQCRPATVIRMAKGENVFHQTQLSEAFPPAARLSAPFHVLLEADEH